MSSEEDVKRLYITPAIKQAGWDSHTQILYLYFQTEQTRQYLAGESVGSTMNNLNQKTLLRTPFPLAPYEQQQRIVRRVDELMEICDQLEVEAEHSQYLSSRLFDSIVHHLFEASS